MKLKWLEIEQFRTVKPGTRLVFDDGINVLLGKNGTGKTTLLELISALMTGNLGAHQHEEFKIAFEAETDLVRLVVHLANTRERAVNAYSWTLDADVVVDGVLVQVFANPHAAQVVLDTEKLASRIWSPMDVSWMAALSFMIGVTAEHVVPDGFLRGLGEVIAGTYSRRFDEALGYFDDYFGARSDVKSDLLPEAHVGPGVSIEKADKKSNNDPVITAEAEWTNDAIIMRSTHPKSWLHHARDLLEVDEITMYVRRTGIELHGDERVIEYGHVDFDFSFADGRLITQRQLSYGQKRVLAFLFYLARVRGPVVADEIVNGMHHDWVEICVQMIREKGQQAFLTSQNPLLLDELEFEDADAVRRTFIIAEVEDGQFRWRQLDEDEARRFFLAYETGIQHVGEVLLTEGLW